MKKAKLITFILLTLGCMLAIFILSSQEKSVSSANSLNVLTRIADLTGKILHVQFNEDQILSLHNFFRKTAHFTAYTILSIFSYNMFRPVISQKKNAIVVTFIFCVLMAVSDEIHQMFVSGRSAEIRDVLIDTLGVCVGLVLVWVVSAIAEKVKNRLVII